MTSCLPYRWRFDRCSGFAAGLVLAVAGAAIALGPAACAKAPAPAPTGKPDGVVARVNGAPITRAALDRVEKFAQFTGTALTDRSAVEQLISEEIIRQQADKLDVAVLAKEVQAREDTLAKSVGGMAALRAQLRSGGLAVTDLEESLRAVMLGEKLQAVMFAATHATRAQALAYYSSRRSLFRQPAAVRLGSIQLRTEAQAKDVSSRIRKGLAFSTAARQFSRDPESRDQGGLLGWVDVASLPQGLAQAVAELEVGELTTSYDQGMWRVVKLYGRRPASTLAFVQVVDVIITELTREQQEAALTKWVQAQRTHVKVAILL